MQYKTEVEKSLFIISKNGTLVLENVVIDCDTEMVDDVSSLPCLDPYITIEGYGQLFTQKPMAVLI